VPYSDARSTNWAWHLVPFASEHKVAANMLKKLLVQGRPLAEHRYPELRYSPRMFLCDWILTAVPNSLCGVPGCFASDRARLVDPARFIALLRVRS
jgi:hypothetical protein